MFTLYAKNSRNEKAKQGMKFHTRKAARLHAKKVRSVEELWFITDPSGETEFLQFNTPGVTNETA